MLNSVLEATFRKVDRVGEGEDDRARVKCCHGLDHTGMERVLCAVIIIRTDGETQERITTNRDRGQTQERSRLHVCDD